jgi:hypothetical protein
MNAFLARLKHSWIAANVAAWNGACVAAAAFLGASAGHALGAALSFDITPLTLKQLGSVFAGKFAWDFFNYFAAHPLRIEEGNTGGLPGNGGGV